MAKSSANGIEPSIPEKCQRGDVTELRNSRFDRGCSQACIALACSFSICSHADSIAPTCHPDSALR